MYSCPVHHLSHDIKGLTPYKSDLISGKISLIDNKLFMGQWGHYWNVGKLGMINQGHNQASYYMNVLDCKVGISSVCHTYALLTILTLKLFENKYFIA